MTEWLTNRVFGALRPVSAPTGAPVTRSLEVSAPNVRFLRNRRGLFVIARAPGLTDQEPTDSNPADEPTLGSIPVTVTLRDPSEHLLSRQVTVHLPLDATPGSPLPAASLFSPMDVMLYPSPLAGVDAGWAVVRASVRRAGTSTGIAGAYLRVRRAAVGGELLGRGLTDARGEAMIPIAGIPVVNWDSDPLAPVLATDINVVFEAYFDASQSPGPPDPDAMETRIATLPRATTNLRLASGREVTVALEIVIT